MIVHPAEQQTEEWLQARIGVVTASQFHRVMTPKTRKPSTAASGYLHELVAEQLIGEPLVGFSSDMMERGRVMETEAVAWYAFVRDVVPERVGLCLGDSGLVGASPDALIGDDGMLEIKCPGPKQHVAYLLGADPQDDHRCQVQGGLWVTGRRWMDIVSYHPTMRPVITRCERDEAFIDSLAEMVFRFTHRVVAAMMTLAYDIYQPKEEHDEHD